MTDRRPPEAHPDRDRRARLHCWREILQLATEGFCPAEARLEAMLDRIEVRP